MTKYFMATVALSINEGLTSSSFFESEIKKALMRQCKETYLLVDHTKFDQASFVKICPLNSIHYVVTDTIPSQEYVDFFSQNGIKLITE